MPVEVILPRVDMDMTTGRISAWHVAEGDTVAKGQVIFEIETDKAAMEIDAPEAGVISGLTPAGGDAIPVGTVVAMIHAAGEAPAPHAATTATSAPPPVQSRATGQTASEAAGLAVAVPTSGQTTGQTGMQAGVQAKGQTADQTGAQTGGQPGTGAPAGLRATPLARSLARAAGINIATLAGSGPRGRVQRRDVEAAVEARAAVTTLRPEVAAARDSKPATGAAGETGLRWVQQGAKGPLVLLHGFGADSGSWRGLLPLLPRDLAVAGIDLPGHGQAAGVTVADFDGLVAYVANVLEGAGLTDLHLCGHSLGGAVATALAGGGRLCVRSLTLLAPAGFGPAINAAFLRGFTTAEDAAALRVWMRETVADPDTMPEAFVTGTARLRAEAGLIRVQAALAARLFATGTQLFSVRGALARHTGVQRVLIGLSDRILPGLAPSDFQPATAVHLLPGIGHLPQLEAPALTARLIGESLAGSLRG